MPGDPIGHHTVPRFYLSEFAAAGRLRAIDVESGRAFGVNVRDATTENHFYTLAQHQTPGVFERQLGSIETDTAPIIARVLDGGWPLSSSDRATLAGYMAVQILRGPDHRRQLHTYVQGLLHRLSMSDHEKFETIADLPSAPEALDGSEPLVGASIHADQIARLQRRLTLSFAERPWDLVSFGTAALITSDAPVSPVGDPRADPNTGVTVENAYAMLLPLARDRGLLLGSLRHLVRVPGAVELATSGELDQVTAGDRGHQDLFNRNAVMYAHRHVFHHPDDAHLVPAGVTALAKRGGRMDLSSPPPVI